MARISKKGATSVTRDLDRLANLVETDFETLGVSPKFATAFVYSCDLLSDAIDKTAGIERSEKTASFDAAQIGVEKAGPLVKDADEGYLGIEFTQQENRELRNKTQAGLPSVGQSDPEPRSPTPGKQASELLQAADAYAAVSSRLANTVIAAAAQSMAKSLVAVRSDLIAGSSTDADTALKCAAEVYPHLVALATGKQAGTQDKYELLAIRGASILSKAAGCEKLPEGGMRDNCEKKVEESKGDDKADDKEEKKASTHGYDLLGE